MSSVEQSWQRIKAWLSANVSDLVERFPGPASAEAVAAVEARIGMSLPSELRASYLLQDGADYGEDELNIFPPPPEAVDRMAFCLLPIESVADEWEVWKDLIDSNEFEGQTGAPAPGITDQWWSERWIPVAGNGGGDFICVDLGPAEGGREGQVICAWHDDDPRALLAPSWGSFLERLADEMESGKLEFDEDNGIVRSD